MVRPEEKLRLPTHGGKGCQARGLPVGSRYLENVFPDMMVPTREHLHGKGRLENSVTKMCLDTLSAKEADMKAGIYPCSTSVPSENQLFFFTKKYGELRREGTFGGRCVMSPLPLSHTHSLACAGLAAFLPSTERGL
jgi:hypothetical protein